MWAIVTILAKDVEQVQSFLKDGYEPFAVTPDFPSERLWLKKEVDEIYSEQIQSDEGGSREDSPKSQE